MHIVICPCCHVGEASPDGEPVALENVGLFRCDHCGARVVFGRVMPRVVIERVVDERGFGWIRKRYQDARTKEDLYVVDLDPKYAAMEVAEVLSVTVMS